MRKLFVLLTVLLLSGVMVSGVYAKEIDQKCWDLVRLYWDCAEFQYKYIIDADVEDAISEKYLVMIRSFDDKLNILSEGIISDSLSEDMKIREFSEFYSQCPIELRPVFDRVVENIMIHTKVAKPSKNTGRMIREYFPGFGYSEPGYKYRKGNELSSEFLYARWEDEERTYTEEKEIELTVELKLVAELKLKFPDLKIIKEFGVEIGETLVYCAKIRIKNTKTLAFHTKKKYGHYKKWFEIFKAKKTWFSTPVWEKCGQTYVNFVEPTGEEVATSIK